MPISACLFDAAYEPFMPAKDPNSGHLAKTLISGRVPIRNGILENPGLINSTEK